MTAPKKRARRSSFGRLRQERSGRWSAAYLHAGTLHRAPATFGTKLDASGWLATERRLIDLETWTPPSSRATARKAARVTLGEYGEKWLKNRPLARMTRDHYSGLWTQHIEPVLGDTPLTDLTPEDVRDWFGGLDASKPTMKARAYGLLTAILNTAVDDDLIPRSPAKIKGGTAVKHTKRSVVLLDSDDLAALAAKMPEQIRLTVLLAGWCALRRGELFALTRSDVGDKCATINVSKAVLTRRGRTEVGPPKTAGSVRTVTVPPPLRSKIAEHLENHVDPAPSALLFPDPVSGGHYTEGRFRGPFDSAKKSIGREGLRFHDLRHFGGVMAAQTGATTAEVMDRLGHTTSAAAMRYQHVAAGRAALLADRLAALFPSE